MTRWTIDLWISDSGACYLERDFLESLRKKDKVLFASLEKRMDTYTQNSFEDMQKLKLLKKVKSQEGIWEIVFSLHRNEIRFLGPLVEKSDKTMIFYALHGFKKKEQEIKQKYINITKSRLEEFNKSKNEL